MLAAATTPRGEGWKKLRGKARMGGGGGGGDAPGTPRSPTVYDWCVALSSGPHGLPNSDHHIWL
jgi:hypothetical protein